MKKFFAILSLMTMSLAAFANSSDKTKGIVCNAIDSAVYGDLSDQFRQEHLADVQSYAKMGYVYTYGAGVRDCSLYGIDKVNKFEILLLMKRDKVLVRDYVGGVVMAKVRISGEYNSAKEDLILSGNSMHLISRAGVRGTIETARIDKDDDVIVILREYRDSKDYSFLPSWYTLGRKLVVQANGAKENIPFKFKGHFLSDGGTCEISGVWGVKGLFFENGYREPYVTELEVKSMIFPKNSDSNSNLARYADLFANNHAVSFLSDQAVRNTGRQQQPLRYDSVSLNAKDRGFAPSPSIQISFSNDGEPVSYKVLLTDLISETCVFDLRQLYFKD